jgi:acetyl esterase/lipase
MRKKHSKRYGPKRIRFGTLGGIGLLFATLTGCAPVDLLNATIATSGLKITRDIDYGADPHQRLDIYVPKSAGANAPVIVFFYGGAWQSGDKGDYLFAAQALASDGAIVVVPNYRVYPQVTFPVFIDDGASAIAWTVHNIQKYGGNPDGLFIAGHSAGAYIAIMLALNQSYLTAAGVAQSHIAGAIGLAGPYDFLPLTRDDIKPIFEVVHDIQVTQPIHYARADAPPLLLIAGDADDTVAPYNTTNLTKRIEELGGQVDEHLYPGVGHVGTVLALTPLFNGKADILARIQTFVKTNQRSR